MLNIQGEDGALAALDSGTNKRSVFNDKRFFPFGVQPFKGSLTVADGRNTKQQKKHVFIGTCAYGLTDNRGNLTKVKNKGQLLCESFPINLLCCNKVWYNSDGSQTDHDIFFKDGKCVFNLSAEHPVVVPIVKKGGLHCLDLKFVSKTDDRKPRDQ